MRRVLAAGALSAGLLLTAAPAADACTLSGCIAGVCDLARDCELGLGCYKVIGATFCL